jgi:hypothetical protein
VKKSNVATDKRMQPVLVLLTADNLKLLDKEASERGESRSSVVRELVRQRFGTAAPVSA